SGVSGYPARHRRARARPAGEVGDGQAFVRVDGYGSRAGRRVRHGGGGTLRATSRKRVQFKRLQRKTQRVVIFGRVDGGGGSGNARAKVTYRTRGHVDGA